MSRPGKVRALLATLRIANAPSVVSNVWLGYWIGWALCDLQIPAWNSITVLCIAGVCLYFSGNLANDWFDRSWDAIRRPERALPAGHFPPGTYLAGSLVLGISGILLSFSQSLDCGICSLVIATLITVYTRHHKSAVWAVVPMGLCRAGLYFLGFLVSKPDPKHLDWMGYHPELFAFGNIVTLIPMAVGLFCYIVGLSLSARYEGMEDAPQGPRFISRALLVLPLLAMSCLFMERPLFVLVGMVPYAAWLALCFTRFRKPIPRYVSALLAGIPLVDFIAAAPLALGGLYWERGAMTSLFIVPLTAFVLGRLLQKVAPAT